MPRSPGRSEDVGSQLPLSYADLALEMYGRVTRSVPSAGLVAGGTLVLVAAAEEGELAVLDPHHGAALVAGLAAGSEGHGRHQPAQRLPLEGAQAGQYVGRGGVVGPGRRHLF